MVNGISPETTIKECKDVFAFQQIIKTGGSFEGSYHYVNGVREEIQKVNRVYAVKDPKYGEVVKGKWITEKRRKNKETGKMESISVDPPKWSETIISECPTHCFIDNENVLTVEDLDLRYYIDMAKKRIDKYINIDSKVEKELNKIKEVITIMAEKKTAEVTDFRDKNIYIKLAEARKRFLETPVKKSGVNRFAEFKYFELEDIVPVANSIFYDLGLLLVPNITYERVVGVVFNVDNPDEHINFNLPAKDPNIEDGTKMSTIQGLGAYVTYQRRYLYGVVLDLVENDAVDKTIGKNDSGSYPPPNAEKGEVAPPKKSNRPATPAERAETKEQLINQDGEATATQIKAIKNGLKKLREKDEAYDGFVTESIKKIKAGLTKTDAEDMLIEIGKKVEE